MTTFSYVLFFLAHSISAIVHENLHGTPIGWIEPDQNVLDHKQLHLTAYLQYRNVDQLETMLKAVSSRSSPDYGKYLSNEEVEDYFAPARESSETVATWLRDARATNIVQTKSAVHFNVTLGLANDMLDTRFNQYTDGVNTQLWCESYSVPEPLLDHIDTIAPTLFSGNRGCRRRKSLTSLQHLDTSQGGFQSYCNATISVAGPHNSTEHIPIVTPECLQRLYRTSNYIPDATSGSTTGFGNFLNQSASYSDLDLFENHFNLPKQNFSILGLVNGGTNSQDPASEVDSEANLDIQTLVSIASGLPIFAYSTGRLAPLHPNLVEPNSSYNQNEPYLPYYEYLLSQPDDKLPWVLTSSYADDENSVPERYARRVCTQIGLLGLRGRTVLHSSGDNGVGGICRSNDNGTDLGDGAPQFTPMFPASCPYVTAVGGTMFLGPESAWNLSSGGFSRYFRRPWYQEDAVDGYLDRYMDQDAKARYARNDYVDFQGRGFPDIAAHSFLPDYPVVVNGSVFATGGTSASAPVVAGIVALLNDARLRAGKPAMGFLNPWLYSETGRHSLTDVTHGGSVGCLGYAVQSNVPGTSGAVIPFASFNATVGWDPVTGLGTPDFMRMEEAIFE